MEEIADRPFPSSSSSVDGLLLPPPPPPPPPPSLATGASSVARYDGDDDDDEEGDVCRICRNPGDAENPLRYPCACSGSIKFVHQDCLLQWLSHSNARQCEVCKHTFSFSPVYALNAPARLPFQEFVVGMAMKACHVLQFFLRLAFVLSVWLLMIPFITFWIWRLSFVRSLGEAQRLFMSHISVPVIFTDCLHGFLLSAGIVFIFLGATSLRDYFRHLRELGGHDAERDDEGQERNGARAVRRLPGPVNRIPVGDGNAEDGGGAQGIAGAGQMIRRNAENVAARLEMQAARLEAHVEQMFDGLDDADGAEDVPFDELVGMQGPVFHLVENAITVLASNAIFLGVVVFLPFSLGRVVLYYVTWFFSSVSSPLMGKVMPLSLSVLSMANSTLKNTLTAANLSTESNNEGLLGHMMEVVTGSQKMNATELDDISNGVGRSISSDLFKGTVIGSSHLSDVTTLAVGYMFIFCFVIFYLGLLALIRYSRGERVIFGRLYNILTIAEAIPSLLRQSLVGMRHLMTMIKVAFLLVIELGVFPLMCGWWLDVCTLRMLGTTIAQRVEFFSASPLTSSSIHWLVGIVYMLQISIFVSLLRGVLRNGVLYFLRDPADPNYNPFRDLIDDPVHKHARRVLLSVAVYGSLIVMLVFLPVKLSMRLAPTMFPFDITHVFSSFLNLVVVLFDSRNSESTIAYCGITFAICSIFDPFTEIPTDVLLFQICIPFAIEHFKLRTTIKSLLRHWFTAVGWALGLTDYLLPPPEENGTQDAGNIELIRQDRLHNVRQGGAGRNDQPLIPRIVGEDHQGRRVIVGDADAVEESDVDDQADSEYGFVLRIVLLLVLAWMTLLIFNSAMIILPVYLGRALFNAIPRLPITHGFKCNDIFAFSIGCYIIWTIVAATRYSIDYIRTHRVPVLLLQIWKWCAIILKSSALLSIWIFIIPVLIGLLFELLVIVPLRVPVDESPVFLLYQDWALGLIFLKIWTRLVILDQMAPLVDENWRRKFERVREDGFSRLRGLWVLREIMIPIISKLLTALCIPYVFAKGVFPVFGYPLIVNSAVYRFAWLGCLVFSLVCFCAKRFNAWFTNLHNSIRDDRYLVGRRLHNYGEEITSESETGSDVQELNSADPGLIHREQDADIGLRFRRANQFPNQRGRQML